MAGQKRRGRQITAEALDEKISKAQDKLVATKKTYDEALSGRMICITGWSAASGLMNR